MQNRFGSFRISARRKGEGDRTWWMNIGEDYQGIPKPPQTLRRHISKDPLWRDDESEATIFVSSETALNWCGFIFKHLTAFTAVTVSEAK
jgi:hypothetical protein